MPTNSEMLEQFEATYAMGDASIDHTHREFLELCVAAAQAQGAAFAERFAALFAHTQAHFADEEARMQASAYQSLLGDMERFCQRAGAGRSAMARAWLNDSLPQWFDLHARTMDSALAVHLRQQG